MDVEKSIKIGHQDVYEDDGSTAYIVIFEIHNKVDRFDIVYKAHFPEHFKQSEKTFRIYKYVFN